MSFRQATAMMIIGAEFSVVAFSSANPSASQRRRFVCGQDRAIFKTFLDIRQRHAEAIEVIVVRTDDAGNGSKRTERPDSA